MPKRDSHGEFLRSALTVARGGIVLAAITPAAYHLHLNAATAGFLYLIAVVLSCLNSSFASAAIVSLLAVGCLDYFFVDPVFAWRVDKPVDVAALVSFLTTLLAITRLAGRARDEANAARHERRNLERLYEVAQVLLTLDPLGPDPLKLLANVRRVFDLKAACLFDAATAALHMAGNASGDLGARTRDAFIMATDRDEAVAGVSVRCLRAGGETMGAIGFESLEDAGRIAGPLAALVAAGMQRAEAVRSATLADAEARGEQLRTAILDALAHEFKTPLAAILTAAGGLRAAGPLRPEQSELAEIVETEADRLSTLSSRLLHLARLDREEVRPRLIATDISTVVAEVVERYARQSPDRQISVTTRGRAAEVLADKELYRLALSQLLDNACRYSPASSPVKVSLECDRRLVTVIVWNGGSIRPSERSLIFERFYRGVEGRRFASGSGLGLYVARKIALAHGGSIDLDTSPAAADGVTFRLAIPVSGDQSVLVERTSQSADCGR